MALSRNEILRLL